MSNIPNPAAESSDVPHPGTQEAIDQLCSCPILDNAYGQGYMKLKDGTVLYVMSEDCPLHSTNAIVRTRR